MSQAVGPVRRALRRCLVLLVAASFAASVASQPRAVLAMAAMDAGHGAMAMDGPAGPRVGAAAMPAATPRAPSPAGMPAGGQGCCGCLEPCCAGCAPPAVPAAAPQPLVAALTLAVPAAPLVAGRLGAATPHRQPLPTGPPSAPLA